MSKLQTGNCVNKAVAIICCQNHRLVFYWGYTNSFSTSCWILYNSYLHWQLHMCRFLGTYRCSSPQTPYVKASLWSFLRCVWLSSNCHQSEGSQLDCEAQLWGFPCPGQAPAPLYLWPPLLPVARVASIGQFDRPVRSKELQVCHLKCFLGSFGFFNLSFSSVSRWHRFIFTAYKDIIGKI